MAQLRRWELPQDLGSHLDQVDPLKTVFACAAIAVRQVRHALDSRGQVGDMSTTCCHHAEEGTSL